MYFFLFFFFISMYKDTENTNPHVVFLNDSQKLDSISKENLWLKLGKEIYRRQVSFIDKIVTKLFIKKNVNMLLC